MNKKATATVYAKIKFVYIEDMNEEERNNAIAIVKVGLKRTPLRKIADRLLEILNKETENE
jgi:hypothetical protein